MRRLEGTKRLVLKLIEQSCAHHNISPKDTILMEWANTTGNEEVIFNSRIKSFKEFDIFLDHVSTFLGDLSKSCPKGLEQYKENKDKEEALKKNAKSKS